MTFIGRGDARAAMSVERFRLEHDLAIEQVAGMTFDAVAAPLSRLTEASALAYHIHADQLRKGTQVPYISHLLAVASIVMEYGGDEEQACAGLLHDAIEDGGIAWEKVIEDKFGTRVAEIVRACTDADTLPKPPWRERKEAYLAHLEQESADAVLVSAADKLHNARAIVADLRTYGPEVFSRFKAGREGTLWYCEALAAVVAHRLPGPLARDLTDAVRTMRSLAFVDPAQPVAG